MAAVGRVSVNVIDAAGLEPVIKPGRRVLTKDCRLAVLKEVANEAIGFALGLHQPAEAPFELLPQRQLDCFLGNFVPVDAKDRAAPSAFATIFGGNEGAIDAGKR